MFWNQELAGHFAAIYPTNLKKNLSRVLKEIQSQNCMVRANLVVVSGTFIFPLEIWLHLLQVSLVNREVTNLQYLENL